jgi:hypothetical protein
LSGEVIFTDVRSGALQRFERFALGMERCAGHSRERLAAEGRLDDVLFVDLGDRGEGDDLPPFLLENMADQIILVQPLAR